MNERQDISRLLSALEAEMRQLHLWSDTPPDDSALASVQPFCYDSMTFGEWLQWVFLPRIKAMLASGLGLGLPARCDIAPLAETWLQEKELAAEAVRLLGIIRDLDRCLTAAGAGSNRFH